MTAIPPTDPPIIAAVIPHAPGQVAAPVRARPQHPGGGAHETHPAQPHPVAHSRATGAVSWTRATDTRAWKDDGGEYIDTAGGPGVPVLGHAHRGLACQRAKARHGVAGQVTEHHQPHRRSARKPHAATMRLTSRGTGARPLLPAPRIPGADDPRGPVSAPPGLAQPAAWCAGPAGRRTGGGTR
ncbi:hypothetical protein Rmf_14730 [Roseomonas fluvialis]|uniref:Aminotransferase class III-fold pyridoxal phosphate-dependent enzyme n=1 Tax=Roseomonas fluvialis TaxID=1750527 RepID=A0ABM7Y1A9_9PROT|nr:hypothetical protein Rmf_14730 [Roseomonas fluvialis]